MIKGINSANFRDTAFLLVNNGVVVESGYAFTELTGYSKAEVYQKDITEILFELLRVKCSVYDLENNKANTDLFLFTKSYEAIEVIISINQLENIAQQLYILTEKPNSRLETKLIFVQELFVENVVGVNIFSVPDLILLKANQKYLDFLDAPYNRIENSLGKSIKEIVTGFEGSQLEINLNNILQAQKTFQINEFASDFFTNGTTYWDLIYKPIFENGKMKYIFGFVKEVTERVHGRQQSEEQSKIIHYKNEELLKVGKEKIDTLKKAIVMKDEFLSIISHEFKTPITVINSAIQAMELICKNELSDKAKGFLNKIRQNSNRQLKLVNNLLDITRINSGHFEIHKKDMDMVLLTKSITESIAIFAEQKHIKLSFSSTLREKLIGIDEEKFERILLNLLSNAVKFTPEGKSVTVKVSQKVVNRKCMVCIQVNDKGIGIPYDKQKLIFERFGQVDSSLSRQAEGTGIGLSLVKMLVEMMGGEIILESKPGAGSTFTILLPVTKAKETPIEQLINEISDKRLIQATAIEFSDIYL